MNIRYQKSYQNSAHHSLFLLFFYVSMNSYRVLDYHIQQLNKIYRISHMKLCLIQDLLLYFI
jgi:hypothetical protein